MAWSLLVGLAHAQTLQAQFTPGPAFAQAVASRATGVFRLGTSRFDRREALTYALLNHGEILQVESRAAGQWLGRMPGSRGAGALQASQFDRLMLLVSGPDVDISQLPRAEQQKFEVIAGFVASRPLPVAKSAAMPTLKLRCFSRMAISVSCVPGQPVASDAARSQLGPRCGPIGCEQYFAVADSDGLRLRLEFDLETGRWGFVGSGIVAIWATPPVP